MATTQLSIQDQVLQAKAQALENAPTSVSPGLANHQPADSHPFQVNSQPAIAYPAPGAAAVQILSYVVPAGMLAVINALVIAAIGGGFSDFSGNVIWRCLINGAGIDGLENITAHMGDLNTPNPVQILLNENDVFQITVEVPATSIPQPGTTAARILGWTYPLGKVSDLNL